MIKNKKNNKKRFVMYKGWQLLLEFITVSCVMVIVMSLVESEWTLEYFKVVGILAMVATVCGVLIHKFGKEY